MNLIKILNKKPIVINNNEEVNYEQLQIRYEDNEWSFHVKINERWYDVILTDNETEILIN